MKKSFLALIPLAFLLTACGGNNSTKPEKPTAQTTVADINENGEYRYTVSVYLPDGQLYTAPGLQGQWCTAKACMQPQRLVDGTATAWLGKDTYYVHVLGLDEEEYAYNVNAYVADENNRSLDVQLVQLNSFKSGDGTAASPYSVGVGAYTSTHKDVSVKGIQYYSFKSDKAGTFEIESWAQYVQALNELDPTFYEVSTETQIEKGGVGNNFKTTFTVEANVEYKFALFLYPRTNLQTTATETNPATFTFTINEV